jgi:hypothetical protein
MYLTIPLEDNAEHCDFNVVCLKRPSHCLPAGDQVERRREDCSEAKTFKSPLQRLDTWRLERLEKSNSSQARI